MRHLRRTALTTLALLALSIPSGCMGRMALTGSVSKANLAVSEQDWVRETLFIGLHLIGVYPICAVIDLFVINTIEYYSEENPINGEPPLLKKTTDI